MMLEIAEILRMDLDSMCVVADMGGKEKKQVILSVWREIYIQV